MLSHLKIVFVQIIGNDWNCKKLGTKILEETGIWTIANIQKPAGSVRCIMYNGVWIDRSQRWKFEAFCETDWKQQFLVGITSSITGPSDWWAYNICRNLVDRSARSDSSPGRRCLPSPPDRLPLWNFGCDFINKHVIERPSLRMRKTINFAQRKRRKGAKITVKLSFCSLVFLVI